VNIFLIFMPTKSPFEIGSSCSAHIALFSFLDCSYSFVFSVIPTRRSDFGVGGGGGGGAGGGGGGGGFFFLVFSPSKPR